MRFILACLILSFSALCCLSTVKFGRKRVQALEQSNSMLKRISMHIASERLELPVILEKLCDSGQYEELDYLYRCMQSIKNGVDFDEAWAEAVKTTCLPLIDKEKELLVSLGGRLGKTDSECQKEIFSDFFTEFGECIFDAREYGKKNTSPVCAVIMAVGTVLSLTVI